MAQLPHVLKRIRLNLARTKEFPSGSERHGYEFVAPLDETWHINPALWQRYREHCRVRRFWGEAEEFGRLEHKPGGPTHGRWMFVYGNASGEDDEAGHRFAAHAFRPGEYVPIRDQEGVLNTFQVVSTQPAT
jgi:hypothetical protein